MMSTATINAFHTKNRIVPSRSCIYRAKTECPTSGNCRKESVVYPATASQSIITLPKPTWTERKTRYSNHKSSFSKANKCHNTELGKYIWYSKENLTKSSGGFCNTQPRPTALLTGVTYVSGRSILSFASLI